MPIKSLAVFCGSKNGLNPLFSNHALELGAILAQHNVKLIYGGGSAGIMGTIADSVMAGKGEVVGIIPELLLEWERQHTNITELIVADDMHTRKKLLYNMCDAALILPGGFGTLDELFEILTWNQLSIHDKPIYVLNSDGFYDRLIDHMKFLEQSGFLYEPIDVKMKFLKEPKELFV